MNLEKIKKGLIAFKGKTLIYSRCSGENAEPVFFYKILSAEEIKLIDENPFLLISQD